MRVTTDQLLEFTDDGNAQIWLMQFFAYLLIIAGIIINLALIRVRSARRSSSLKSAPTNKKPNPGWSLDLTNTKIDQNR